MEKFSIKAFEKFLLQEEQLLIESAFRIHNVADNFTVIKFEELLAKFLNCDHALATASGTAALHLAFECIGIKKGDVVLASDVTFIASVSPCIHKGAEIGLVDSDRGTWNMCPDALNIALTTLEAEGRTPKCVVLTHLNGLPCDIVRIKALCAEFSVPLVEDAAQALGSVNNDRRSAGTSADMGIISFGGTKIISAGKGGLFLCKDISILRKATMLRNHSKEDGPINIHKEAGFNYKIGNPTAAILIEQMSIINKVILKHKEIFRNYCTLLEKTPLVFQKEVMGTFSNRWNVGVICDKYNAATVIHEMKKKNIEVNRTFYPLHLQPVLRGSKIFHKSENPNSIWLFENAFLIPASYRLTNDNQRIVAESLREISINGATNFS